jgi:hypothetical protein
MGTVRLDFTYDGAGHGEAHCHNCGKKWSTLSFEEIDRHAKACGARERLPDGTPGVRDVDAPCEDYQPGASGPPQSANCESDGHYLCHECRWYAPQLDPGAKEYVEP